MFCKYCGSDKFTAHQICRMDIIVDGSGDFLGNISDDIASDIYDHEQPYGPFQCCGCGAEYDGDNIENAVEISGPAPNWPVPKVEKSHNLHLMTIPQLAEYIASQLNYSYIWKSKFPDCDFGIADYIACPSMAGCEYDGVDDSCCAPCKVKWLLSNWEG